TWEATLMTLNVSVENNYLGLIKDKKSILMGDTKPDIVEDHIVNEYYSRAAKNAALHFMFELPSFFFKADEWAFGFRPIVRTDLSVRGVPAAVSRLSYLG